MARKQKTQTTLEPITLGELANKYREHLEAQGKSAGTVFSYGMELKTAMAELGADTIVSTLTRERIAAFNESPRVTRLKSGKPKAEPSVLKTRRVLRLALGYAEQAGLIERSPVDAAKDAASEADDAAAPDTPAPAAKGKKSRGKQKRGAVVLEVAQPEAEAAADAAEAMVAAGADESAA